MKTQILILEQTDRKIFQLKRSGRIIVPPTGWLYAIRKSLGMSLRQAGSRMGITAQSVREIEERQKGGTISLRVLKDAGAALGLRFVYGFIPEAGSLEKMIEARALELATEIIRRTSVNMKLEDQEVSPARLRKAVREKAGEIIHEMPRYLWD